jgi:hypothetical protein
MELIPPTESNEGAGLLHMMGAMFYKRVVRIHLLITQNQNATVELC